MARITHGHHALTPVTGPQMDPFTAPTSPVTTPSPDPASPPAPAAPAFSDLGVTFNDATRALVGGLWQNVVEEGGQGNGSIVKYTTDLTAVQTGLHGGDQRGAVLRRHADAHVNAILADITTALSAADASVNGGGSFGSVAAAETALHNSHLDILNIVNNDPNLATLATQNGAHRIYGGALNPSPTAPPPRTRLTPPFADIGAIFNDLANISIGGVNASNPARPRPTRTRSSPTCRR